MESTRAGDSRSDNMLNGVELLTPVERRLSTDNSGISSAKENPKWVNIAKKTPLAAGTTAPLSLIISISGLADPFRQTIDDEGISIYDPKPKWVVAMAAVALALEIIGNIALFLNFFGRILSYKIAMHIALVSFHFKVCILFTLIGVFRALYPDPGRIFYSQGYWLTIASAVLTFFTSLFLVLNFWGYRRHYYDRFTLSLRQRLLIMQNIAFMLWVALGALVFAVIEGFSFVEALYFIDVSLLTVGFGDMTLKTTLGRALLMPYTFIGIAVLGLVVAAIRSVVVEDAKDALLKRHMESIRRKKALKRKERARLDAPNGQSEPSADEFARFQEMRKQQKRMEHSRARLTTYTTIGVFVVFWIGGSAVFSATENWTFFEGVYFSFVSLITIGYGDYTVGTDPGRALFIIWSFMAVPLMTIVVSTVGDTFVNTLQKQASRLEEKDSETSLFKKPRNSFTQRSLPDDQDELATFVQKELPQELLKLSGKLVRYAEHVSSAEKYKYSFSEYKEMIEDTGVDYDYDEQTSPGNEDLEFLKNYIMAVEGVNDCLREGLNLLEQRSEDA